MYDSLQTTTRSWNAFGNRINDKIIRNAIDAVTNKSRGKSLYDFGYTRVGIDEVSGFSDHSLDQTTF